MTFGFFNGCGSRTGATTAAEAALKAPCHVEIVDGATHHFEEPGKLEQVAVLARDWFLEFLDNPVQ